MNDLERLKEEIERLKRENEIRSKDYMDLCKKFDQLEESHAAEVERLKLQLEMAWKHFDEAATNRMHTWMANADKDAEVERLKAEVEKIHNDWISTCKSICAENDAELDRMKSWVDDLQSGMYVNCIYCGHRYGPGETTPVSMADALKAHIEKCEKHPMSLLKKQLAAKAEEVEQLKSEIRILTAPVEVGGGVEAGLREKVKKLYSYLDTQTHGASLPSDPVDAVIYLHDSLLKQFELKVQEADRLRKLLSGVEESRDRWIDVNEAAGKELVSMNEEIRTLKSRLENEVGHNSALHQTLQDQDAQMNVLVLALRNLYDVYKNNLDLLQRLGCFDYDEITPETLGALGEIGNILPSPELEVGLEEKLPPNKIHIIQLPNGGVLVPEIYPHPYFSEGYRKSSEEGTSTFRLFYRKEDAEAWVKSYGGPDTVFVYHGMCVQPQGGNS